MEHDRILGYFLEEASEHLHTIEQGLNKLPETVRQPTMIRELFRAAHSIKGSAAMLGLSDVQQVSNQFEANFKLLKERPQIAIDRQLQTLFLDSFNFLRAAIEDVRASNDPYRHDPASPDPIGDPVFEELKSYLQYLLQQSEPVPQPEPTADKLTSEPALEQVFGEYVTRKLGEIAALCLQLDRPDIRSQIQKICQKLGDLGENFEFLEWSNLFAACRLAIANPHNTLPQLGESISIAVKQAQILVLSGRAGAIQIPLDLATLIDRQGRMAPPPAESIDPFQVHNPHDPFAQLPLDGDLTTQKLAVSSTVSTEPLPAPIAPVLSTVTNTLLGTNDLPHSSSQSPTEHLPGMETGDPAIDLTARGDNPIDLSPDSDPNFEVNFAELDDFMNSLDGEMAGDDTWVAGEDLFALPDSTPQDLAELTSAAIAPKNSAVVDLTESEVSIVSLAIAANEYDEETFYTPDIGDFNDGDLGTFWADDPALAPQQSLYTALDLPDNIGDRFQPDSSPALDLEIAAPAFTLDAQMSDLFPSLTSTAPDEFVGEASLKENRSAGLEAVVLVSDTDLPDAPVLEPTDRTAAAIDSQPHTTTAPAPAPIENWEAELPNSQISSNLTSDILYLEDLGSTNRANSAASAAKAANELTDWIDFSLEQNEAAIFTDVDLNSLNSTVESLEFAPAIDFADIDTPTAEWQLADLPVVNFSEPDFNALADNSLQLPLENSNDFGELDLQSIASDLGESDRGDNLGELDFNFSNQDPLQIGAEDSQHVGEFELQSISDDRVAATTDSSQIGELDFNFSTTDLVELESPLDRDSQEFEFDLAAADNLSATGAIDLPASDLDNNPQALEFDLAVTPSEPSDVGDLELSSSNEANHNSNLSSELFDNVDFNDLTDSGRSIEPLASNVAQPELGAESSPSSSLESDLAALDLDLLDTNPVSAAQAEGDALAALDLDFADDLAQLSNFEDLSELEFDLEERSNELTDLALPDLDAVLAAPTSDLADVDSLDALLGGAVATGAGAFDGLDDLIGTPAPTAAAAPLDDLDLLLAPPTPAPVAPVEAVPATTTDKKTPDRRAKQRTFEQTMKVSVRYLDNLNNLVGELVVNRNTLEQDQNRMRQFVEKLLSEVQKLNEVGKRMQDLYERSLMENSLVASRQQHKPTATPINVPANLQDLEQAGSLMEYDPLEMDRFTPIHLLSQKMIELTVRIRESTADIEFVVDDSTEVTRTLRQITGQLQEDLTKSRMVPFAQTADRLQRGVRDNGLKYGKQIVLTVDGRDTLIDKVILESLTDPLIHMVNNGIAHGIESAEVRQAAGKPIEGHITIRAIHQGNQTIISISDDGAGIDTERVKAKAIEKGIITAQQAATMSKNEAYELLFLPSFSTKDQADELAGRGVGMDVVRTSLTEIRGTITTESQLGQGTTFTIRLPLALSIAKALIAVNNKTNIAFPMDGIEDTQDVSPEQIQTDRAGEQCIFWRDELMPFKPLSDLLGYNRPLSRNNFYGAQEDDSDLISILVLRSDGNLIAVQVDKIVGDQEIVIKPLQGPAPKPLGIAGATVLGDGRIVPIADVMELIALSNGTLTRIVPTQMTDRIATPTVELRESMVLIVDDSITVRELLSLTFKRAGYRVEQARDGQEAWDKLRAGLPCDIVFCDIEMPRMDGLEFLSRVQKDAALKKVPVAMLTSRGSDRHRQIASQLGASGYFIKPYLEEALLEAAKRMIQGEVLAIV
jgi:chemotaxis protein histidine kinase CheA/ActR/RegA family two-component response regulator